MMGLFWGRKDETGVDGNAMLAELRAIRQELQHQSEMIGKSATRDDLKNYVTVDLFRHHLESHQKGLENWRTWLPWAAGFGLALFEVMSRLPR